MGSQSYSFLDVAVLETVRGRLAAGDALVVLDAALNEVLWANGPGARLFGFSEIFSCIGADPGLHGAARRQIEATPGFPDVGRNRPIALRLASQMVAFSASSVAMPDGERAILLAAPDGAASARTKQETAGRTIDGLSGDGQFVALIDDHGGVLAASGGFDRLGIVGDTLRALADDVANEADRLVKRLVPSGREPLPAGMARLSEEPPLNLLMIVDESGIDGSAAPEPPASVANDAEVTAIVAPPTREPAPPPPRQPSPETQADTDPENAPTAKTTAEPAPQEPDDAASSSEPAQPVGAAAPTGSATGSSPRTDDDGWYFNGGSRAAAPPTAPSAAPPPYAPASAGPAPAADDEGAAYVPSAEQAAMPLRFVWRTDSDGRFSAISDEFRTAFGDEAADIVGRPFTEIARRFGLDPDNEIAGLLERRDTWSGRAVLWPVAGTDLKVPVDLAALPVYGRDRNFEGFRGFGVARMGDAVVDADAIGLSLRAPAEDDAANAEQPAAEPPAPVVEAPGSSDVGSTVAAEEPPQPAEDPYRGEPPALTTAAESAKPASDKVIRLEERRAGNAARGLSAAERLNFREIGEKLRNSGLVSGSQSETPRPASEPQGISTPPAAVEEAPAPAEEPSEAKAEAPQELEDQAAPAFASEDPASAETAPAEDEPAAQDGEASPEAGGSADANAGIDAPATPPQETAAPAASVESPATRPAEIFMPSAFAGLPTQSGPSGIDTSVLSRLPLPLLVHAGDALFYANREFLQLTGYNSLVELDEAGGLGAIFGDPYHPDETSQRKLRLRTRDGAEFPVDAFLQSVAWNGGKALLLALKRAVDEPAASSAPQPRPLVEGDVDARLEELRAIIDTATDGVVLIGNDGKIRSISRPAEALFGVDNFNVVGQAFTTLFAIESQKAASDYLAGLAENGVASVLNDGREVIGREAQGRFIPLFMTIGRLPHESGFCAVVRDITHWKRAEEDLTEARAAAERASSTKTEFLARVSHEIRTPLNAIIGFSELMLDEKFGPIGNERYRDYLRDINKSGNHVLDLVNDLLDITKIEAGQQEMSYEAVSLNETLGEAVAMMQPQANRERVIIRSSFASRLPEVVADLRSVRQIALNLLSNAIRYTPAGGQVIVSTAYEQSGDIVMRVRDTGIGMAAAEIEQALKPFKQINALKRPRGDGTGLGLPLTKAMVEANRARFAIHSAPGEGTLVEITFPSTRVLAH